MDYENCPYCATPLSWGDEPCGCDESTIAQLQTENAALHAQVERLRAALERMVLAHDQPQSWCGCNDSGHCDWHNAFSLVNELRGDKYGEWYFAAGDLEERP